MPAAVWVRLLSSLENRCVKDRCFWSVLSTNAASNQMAPICLKHWGPEANRTTQTHYNRPFLGTLHVRTIMQMPRGSCQLSLQRTGGDHENALALHGWAPYSRIWDAIISHCLKQWIWPRTSLLGGCGRCMALRSLELHARNDDDDNDVHTSLEAQCCHAAEKDYITVVLSRLSNVGVCDIKRHFTLTCLYGLLLFTWWYVICRIRQRVVLTRGRPSSCRLPRE